MVEDKSFKHISVGDELDDDELIVVGSPVSQGVTHKRDNNTENKSMIDSIQKSDCAPQDKPLRESELEPEPSPVKVNNAKSKSETTRVKKSHEYHETTLEDLEPREAPLTQKIVVIAAIILIIIAILYFVIPK